jgi:hypothetical protein
MSYLIFQSPSLAKTFEMSYSDYLSDVALNNLRTAEASQMVYNVYENFIVPRICKDTLRTKADANGKGSKKRSTCALLPYAKLEDFQKVKSDPTGILFRATKPIKEQFGYKFVNTPKLEAVAPKNYHVTYVGCFRKSGLSQTNANTDCSLFFTISESRSSI